METISYLYKNWCIGIFRLPFYPIVIICSEKQFGIGLCSFDHSFFVNMGKTKKFAASKHPSRKKQRKLQTIIHFSSIWEKERSALIQNAHLAKRNESWKLYLTIHFVVIPKAWNASCESLTRASSLHHKFYGCTY